MLHTRVSCAIALALATIALAAPATTWGAGTAPEVVAVGVSDITATSATLHVAVTTHGLPVTLTASVRGPLVVASGGGTPRGVVATAGPVVATADGDVALPVSGLQSGLPYRWSATAKSTAGTASTPAFTGPGSFRTLALAKVPPPAISAPRAAYGSWVTVSGALAGAPALPVALAQEPFPYAFPFVAVPGAAGATDADGSYRFTVQALATTRYGLLAAGYEGPTAGNSVQLTVFPAVTVHVRRLRGQRFAVSGSYRPDAVADATLYRLGRGRAGDFVTPVSAGDGSRTFRFPARALAPGAYEVRIKTARHKGVASTHSAPFTIPRR